MQYREFYFSFSTISWFYDKDSDFRKMDDYWLRLLGRGFVDYSGEKVFFFSFQALTIVFRFMFKYMVEVIMLTLKGCRLINDWQLCSRCSSHAWNWSKISQGLKRKFSWKIVSDTGFRQFEFMFEQASGERFIVLEINLPCKRYLSCLWVTGTFLWSSSCCFSQRTGKSLLILVGFFE